MSKSVFVVSPAIVESDKFLALSISAQVLYFHLCGQVVEGVINNMKSSMRAYNASENDLQELIHNEFVRKLDDNLYELKG